MNDGFQFEERLEGHLAVDRIELWIDEIGQRFDGHRNSTGSIASRRSAARELKSLMFNLRSPLAYVNISFVQ